MAAEKVQEFLRRVRTDPAAHEALKGLAAPADQEGLVRYYAEIAKRLGADVTEEDLRKTVLEEERIRKERTEKASAEIQALTDDETEAVSGGYCIGMWEYPPDSDPECGDAQAYFKEHGEWCYEMDYDCSGFGVRVWTNTL